MTPGTRATGEERAAMAPGDTDASSFSRLLANEELLDHLRSPRNRGEIMHAEIVWEEENPACGDAVRVSATLSPAGRSIEKMAWTGHGCMLSQAAASLLSERLVGKSLEDVARMGREDVEGLLGGSVSPSRVRCILLPLIALTGGIQRYGARHRPPRRG